ncbi:MAG: sugar phosphate isomerase/epimerase [Leptospiraceae bacterium]|nr:sugar phosphate isomerase/epimerase [Leptospiraceae bacterium]
MENKYDNKIFLSTGCYFNSTSFQVVEELSKHGLTSFELSGGNFDPEFDRKLDQFKSQFNLQIHNYSPPPEIPFVFNLASFKEEVYNRSLEHIKQAIEISSKLNREFFGFHAGYLVDPDPMELGQRFVKRSMQDRNKSLQLFIDRVIEISKFAKEYNIRLLIENNVVSANNFKSFGEDAFLFSEPDEAKTLIEALPENVGVLLDIAHLKVSSNTLSYDPIQFIEVCNPKILAYHISDNNGLSDSNDSIQENFWFWNYLKKDALSYTLEIKNATPESLRQQIELLKSKICN